jgi:hypothetical protein
VARAAGGHRPGGGRGAPAAGNGGGPEGEAAGGGPKELFIRESLFLWPGTNGANGRQMAANSQRAPDRWCLLVAPKMRRCGLLFPHPSCPKTASFSILPLHSCHGKATICPQRLQTRLQQIGRCPMGYAWTQVSGGQAPVSIYVEHVTPHK